MLGHYEQASFILEVNKPCVAEYFALVSVTSSATVPSLIKMFFWVSVKKFSPPRLIHEDSDRRAFYRFGQ
jgi:hypothetical protein